MTYTGISTILSDMKAEFLRQLRNSQVEECQGHDLRGIYTVSICHLLAIYGQDILIVLNYFETPFRRWNLYFVSITAVVWEAKRYNMH